MEYNESYLRGKMDRNYIYIYIYINSQTAVGHSPIEDVLIDRSIEIIIQAYVCSLCNSY